MTRLDTIKSEDEFYNWVSNLNDIKKHFDFSIATEEQIEFFKTEGYIVFCSDISLSSKCKRYQVIAKLLATGTGNYKQRLVDYYATTSSYEKQRILYGEEKLEQLKKIASDIAKKNFERLGAPASKERLLRRGGTEEEYNLRTEKSRIKAEKTRQKNIADGYIAKHGRNSYQYWMDLGYSREDARTILEEEYFFNSYVAPTLEGYIKRYGEEEGTLKFSEVCKKRIATKRERYGTAFIYTRVSKESIRVFTPLLEYLYEKGYDKTRIYGINSKEYFIRTEDEIFFYDCVILDKKIIIEYNGSLWHVNPNVVTRFAPFLDKELTIEKDRRKREIAEANGFTFYVIWDTDNCQEKIQEIIDEHSL